VNGTAIRAACSPHPNPLPRGERGSSVRKLFLTLFSEGRGDRPCGNCLWRSLNPQHSRYPRFRHSAHALLAISPSGILLTPCSLSTPQAFCVLPARYPRLRHSAHSLLAIHASGILLTPCSLSPLQAFCARPSRYLPLRHSVHSPTKAHITRRRPPFARAFAGIIPPMTLQPWDKPCVMKS